MSKVRRQYVRIHISHKVIYRLNVIPILSLFCQSRKANYKIYMALRGGPKSQDSLEKRDKIGGLTFPNFKTHYKTSVTKTV